MAKKLVRRVFSKEDKVTFLKHWAKTGERTGVPDSVLYRWSKEFGIRRTTVSSAKLPGVNGSAKPKGSPGPHAKWRKRRSFSDEQKRELLAQRERGEHPDISRSALDRWRKTLSKQPAAASKGEGVEFPLHAIPDLRKPKKYKSAAWRKGKQYSDEEKIAMVIKWEASGKRTKPWAYYDWRKKFAKQIEAAKRGLPVALNGGSRFPGVNIDQVHHEPLDMATAEKVEANLLRQLVGLYIRMRG